MKVTVLVPTSNRARLLGEAIRSAQRQSLPPHEIIIIDDGSEDDTGAAIASFGSAVRAIRLPQGGKSRALNQGFALATGDAVIVLDDDDIFPPRAIESHVAALAQSPKADFAFGRFLRFQGDLSALAAFDASHPDVEPVPTDDERRTVIKLMEHCYLPHPAWMARREALDRAGPYDEEALRSQDFDMILRLARCNDGVFVDDIVLYQRQHGGQRPGVRGLTGGDDAILAWQLYNQRIFTKIARTWRPEDFRPCQSPAFPGHEERTAWLQKGVILFNHGCYGEAFDAFETYRSLAAYDAPDRVETGIASRMLMRRVAQALLDNDENARAVRKGLRSGGWHLDLVRAFVSGGRWHVGAALRARDYRRAIDLAKFLLEAFGPIGIAAGFAARIADIEPVGSQTATRTANVKPAASGGVGAMSKRQC